MDHDPYGLTDRPFQLTPDPRFYFDSATHRKAMTYLGYGLAQGEGFIVVTGEVGTGKTMLVGRLMGAIDKSRLTAVNLVSTQLEGEDILRIVALSLGVQSEGMAKGQILARIERFLHEQARGGKRTLLIVDEAQNLPITALEELRMLSNFQFGGQALLQIFLLGQPEFREALAQPRFEQLRQRVIATHHLTAMLVDETGPYIMHRLACAGWKGAPRFTAEAFAAMHRLSGGVPRRLNMLAARVLLQGAIEQLVDIDIDVIEDVAADLASESIMPAENATPEGKPQPFQYNPTPVAPAAWIEPQQPAPTPPPPPVAPVIAPQVFPEPAPAPVAAPVPPPAPAPAPNISYSATPQPFVPPAYVEPSYTEPSYDMDEPQAPEAPTGAYDMSGFSMPEQAPPPPIAQPPRYDGDVPPQAQQPEPAPPPVAAAPIEPPAPVYPPLRAVEDVPPPPPPPAPVPDYTTPDYAVPPAPAPAAAAGDNEALRDIAARNAELEARLADQEAILRRTLSLLVELVETKDQGPGGGSGGANGSQDAA
ncbi:XrtA/PEP-CTERM system-associated ATPase [Sphingomonas crocodyli]|uniref:General secretion pathway protein n=1 Tax=Sphingomonas crocodyli TaxID=1979270 RepID=A0A437M7T2_9SPHN|nr:XrtA/PEP-CTERM system-associated ATPase [Sphingomonas crocodyli]RVT93778.1 general secretion pathway protein [Sphingomonas crocodyli]